MISPLAAPSFAFTSGPAACCCPPRAVSTRAARSTPTRRSRATAPCGAVARHAQGLPLRPLASRRLRPGALNVDTQRLVLLSIFGFSVLMLWEAWEKRAIARSRRPQRRSSRGGRSPAPWASRRAQQPPRRQPGSVAVPATEPAARGEIVHVTHRPGHRGDRYAGAAR